MSPDPLLDRGWGLGTRLTTFVTRVANTLWVHIPSYKQEHAMLWSCDLLTTDLLCKHGSLLQEP